MGAESGKNMELFRKSSAFGGKKKLKQKVHTNHQLQFQNVTTERSAVYCFLILLSETKSLNTPVLRLLQNMVKRCL